MALGRPFEYWTIWNLKFKKFGIQIPTVHPKSIFIWILDIFESGIQMVTGQVYNLFQNLWNRKWDFLKNVKGGGGGGYYRFLDQMKKINSTNIFSVA